MEDTMEWTRKLSLDIQNNLITPLTSGASDRQYFRVQGHFSESYHQKSVIVSVYQGYGKNGFHPFIQIQSMLKQYNIPVPLIYEIDYKNTMMILQDIGDTTLQRYGTDKKAEDLKSLYKRIIKDLAFIHSKGNEIANEFDVLNKPFDRGDKLVDYGDIYQFDMDFHGKQLLLKDYLEYDGSWDSIDLIFKNLSQSLKKNITGPFYRDCQSSNIMLFNDRLYYIDFQDMRLGNPHYDIASLLFDVYIPDLKPYVDELIKYYLKSCQDYGMIVSDHFEDVFSIALCHRKIHDAGVFAWIYTKRNDPLYYSYLIRCMDQLLWILNQKSDWHILRDIIATLWEKKKQN